MYLNKHNIVTPHFTGSMCPSESCHKGISPDEYGWYNGCLSVPGLKLEQLECLRSEDTLCHLMITHTIESYWILSQKKTKSKLQI